ncbi:MAG: response regulator [Acidobacteriota bacterium]|nr:response regulator [Acidobacteriota bacterium]
MAKKILLADDSLTIQKVVELTFSDSDYELFSVSNGQKALDRVREFRPDLILADAVMPEKNGYEVCEAIKGDPATAKIPVILLSGTFEPFDRERAERIGADAIVSKPFDSQQLLAQVDALLDRSPASGSYSASASEPFPIPQTTAGVAVPAEPEPPPPSSHETGDEAPFDTGFSAEDFTASIRMPPHRSSSVDPFEEEYGARGDVDSAIEAFEKSQGAATGSEQVETAPAAAETSDMDDTEETEETKETEERKEREEAPVAAAPEPSPEPLASWLRDEPERAPAAPSFFPDVSDKTEPLALPLPVDPFDSGMAAPLLNVAGHGSSTGMSSVPPDQMPTMELPQMHFDHRDGASDSGSERPAVEISEHEARDLFEVGSSRPQAFEPERDFRPEPEPEREAEAPAAAPPPMPSSSPAPAHAAAGVHGEIEMLAQRSSIPELTQMLSSVRSIDMTDEQIERLATRVVEKLSDRIVREIAWEVIPDMAEIVIKQRIKELESGIE